MAELMKEAIKVLHGILSPIASKLGNANARKQFNQSIGYSEGANPASPTFPDGSAMKAYYENEEKNKDALLLAQSLQEVSQIIDVLRGLYGVGIEPWYNIKPGDPNKNERIQMAISELITLILNIFTLDYVRFKYPRLHNLFMMIGMVDEMSQRAGGSGFVWRVIGDYFKKFGKGFALKDDESTHTTVEALVLALNVLKFIAFSDSEFFFSGGFETYKDSRLPNADNASKAMVSAAWYFQHLEQIKGNLFFTLGLIPRTRSGGGFFARLDVPGNFDHQFNDKFRMKVAAEGDLQFFYADDIEADLSPGKANKVSLFFEFTTKPDSFSLIKQPLLSFGYGKKHSVEFRLSKDELGILLSTEINVKFSKGSSTSFPFSFIPQNEYDKNLPVSFGWTNKRGWFFNDAGTAGTNTSSTSQALSGDGTTPPAENKVNLFFLNFPLRQIFGGLSFQNVHVGLGTDGDKRIIETSLDFSFSIGSAFTLAVTRLGARIGITPRDDEKGFFGNDLDIDVKFPTGIGIVIDVSAVKGGGFLSIDREKGEYIGAIELAINLEFCAFEVKAFGIIQTKIPGAPPNEYSLFVVISSDFEPVSIIFGLTLNGVGGLFGHNRTVDISLLQSEMRSPYLENILFLKNPIANVGRLVSDAGRYFPVGIDKTLLGVSLIIGYGIPTIFELKMAVIILRPDNTILIPGFMRLQTPQKSKILQLQINFLAILDLKEGYLFFRADLVDSKLATFKLTGSLVLAIGWGDSDGLFALTIGGFHPSFKDFPQIKALPNAFKSLDRLRLSLWEEGKNHLYLEMYLALTSNSRQLGARAYLHVQGPAGFNIDGQLGFDALWETEPRTYFEIKIDARIDFRRNEDVLAGVSLDALLTGPTPKHIEGKARLKICWFLTVSIPFNKTWGSPAPAVEEELVDAVALLRAQINDDRNWRTEVPQFNHLNVTLRTTPGKPANEITIQPLGALVFTQHEVPLNFKIQRVGTRKAQSETTLSIGTISSNGSTFTDLQPTEELFAAGNFINLKEDEKLSRPSFERMTSGVRIGDTGISQFPKPFVKARQPEFELEYIRPVPTRKKRERLILSAIAFKTMTRGAAVSKHVHSWQAGKGKNTSPKKQEVLTEKFVIANTSDMKMFTGAQTDGIKVTSRSQASEIARQLVKEKPALKGAIQVVGAHELIV